ncbi:MAG: hypothetical protein ACYCQK_02720 [Acidiferrobacteraceae bacterium]
MKTTIANTAACDHGIHSLTSTHFSVPFSMRAWAAAIHVPRGAPAAQHLLSDQKFFWFILGYMTALVVGAFMRQLFEWSEERRERAKDCVRHLTHPPADAAPDKQDPPF